MNFLEISHQSSPCCGSHSCVVRVRLVLVGRNTSVYLCCLSGAIFTTVLILQNHTTITNWKPCWISSNNDSHSELLANDMRGIRHMTRDTDVIGQHTYGRLSFFWHCKIYI